MDHLERALAPQKQHREAQKRQGLGLGYTGVTIPPEPTEAEKAAQAAAKAAREAENQQAAEKHRGLGHTGTTRQTDPTPPTPSLAENTSEDLFQQKVVEIHRQHPDWTAAEISLALTVKPNEPPAVKQANWLVPRHWRGDYSLGRSYWVNAIIAGCVLIPVYVVVAILCALALAPAVSGALLMLLIATSLAAEIWLWVGTWRAANKHTARTGKRFWSGVAKAMIIFSVISTPAQIVADYNNPAFKTAYYNPAALAQ